MATALAICVTAINIFTGLYFPFIATPERAGRWIRCALSALIGWPCSRRERWCAAACWRCKGWRRNCSPIACFCAFRDFCNWHHSSDPGTVLSQAAVSQSAFRRLDAVVLVLRPFSKPERQRGFNALSMRGYSRWRCLDDRRFTFAMAYRRSIRRSWSSPISHPPTGRAPPRAWERGWPASCCRDPSTAPSCFSPREDWREPPTPAAVGRIHGNRAWRSPWPTRANTFTAR